MKRSICLLLSVVMLITALPMGAFAQTEPAQQAQPEVAADVSLEGSNSFGNLLADELETLSGGDAQAEQGYSVVGLTVENATATVEYSSLEDACLIVCIYTEDGMQLVASGNALVSADATVAEVAIGGEMPQYFLASAFLVDVYDYSPLCAAYDTPMYTQQMQQLLASTVADYDAQKVVQLSDSTQTNFAVYNDSVVVIDGGDGVNTVADVDYETDTYIIENPDAQITGLVPGAVFAYPWAEGELLIVKVAQIDIDGTTAVITGAQMELEEAFDYLKLETQAGMEEAELDSSTLEQGITYEGKMEPPSTYAWEGGTDISKSFFFGLEKEFPSQNAGGKVTVSGGLTLGIQGSLSFYISLKKQFLEMKVTPELGVTCTASGVLNAQELSLGKVKLPTGIPGVVLEGTPKLVLQFGAQVEFAAKISMQMGIGYESNKGFQNLCTKPTAQSDITISGKVYLGLILKCSAAIIDENIASIGVSNQLGLQVTGTLTGMDVAGEPAEDAPTVHTCGGCLDIRYDCVYSLSGEMIFLKYIKVEKVYKSVTVHLFNSYFVTDGSASGFGSCPNIQYRTVLKCTEYGAYAGGVALKEGSDDWGETNDNGVLVKYLPAGAYTVTAERGDSSAQKTFFVKEPGSVNISLKHEQSQNGTPGIFDWIDPERFNTSRYDLTFKNTGLNNFLVEGNTLYFDNETTIDPFITTTSPNFTAYMGAVSSEDIVTMDQTKPVFLQQTIQIDALPVYTGGSVIMSNSSMAKGMAFSITKRPHSATGWASMFLGSIQQVANGELALFIADRVTYSTNHKAPPLMLGVKVGEKFELGVMWSPDSSAQIYVNGKCIASYSEATRNTYYSNSVGAYYHCNYTNITEDAKFTVSDIKMYSQNPYGDVQLANEDVMTLSLVAPEEVEATQNQQSGTSRSVVGGEYGTDGTVKTASFANLVPGEEYLLLALADTDVEDPLTASNLLFADQLAASEDGTLQVRYIQRQETAFAYVMACGPSNKHLSDARITLPGAWEDPQGQTQAVSPVVEYEGQTLVEGQDYTVVGKADYTKPGTYTCYIRGIYNYTGLVECTYEVQPWSWTLAGDVQLDALTVPAHVTLDLNGHTLTVKDLASFGDIIDTVGTGSLVAEALVLTDNSFLPVFNSEDNSYRFFPYSFDALGVKTGEGAVTYGFALSFEDPAAYTLLSQSGDPKLNITTELSWGQETLNFTFSPELIRHYGALQLDYPDIPAALRLTVTGLEALDTGTAVTAAPGMTAADGQITEKCERMTYTLG